MFVLSLEEIDVDQIEYQVMFVHAFHLVNNNPENGYRLVKVLDYPR